ncbi:MAG: SGNH/GDSL hydrolase family protein [bacterium]|jgi:lysophospholipase L1-like esterase|nr:SGNH/GDSL hydrolase family protein [bacterium]
MNTPLHPRILWLKTFCQKHPRWINTILVMVSIGFVVSVCETGFRLYIRTTDPILATAIQRFAWEAAHEDTKSRFVPHPYLSYAPRSIEYKNGGIQIRDQYFAFQKPEGTLRIACLGGSTTMEQYPLVLTDAVKARLGETQAVEVMDFGCDGWTLIESTLNYMLRIADFSPDYVIVHHGANDIAGRLWPNYKPDFTHYRKHYEERWLGWFSRKYLSFSWMVTSLLHRSGMSSVDILNLTTHTVPYETLNTEYEPQTLYPFEKYFQVLFLLCQVQQSHLIYMPMAYCAEKKDYFDLALIESFNQSGRRIAKELSIPVVEAGPLLQGRPELFKDVVHLTPEGNQIKAQLLADTIASIEKNP